MINRTEKLKPDLKSACNSESTPGCPTQSIDHVHYLTLVALPRVHDYKLSAKTKISQKFFALPCFYIHVGIFSLLLILPEYVENFSIWMDPNQDVGNGDELKIGLLSVRKVDFGFPNGFNQIRICQIQR